MSQVKKRVWSDSSILKAIKNPSPDSYEVKIKAPEITFMGGKDRPDFASACLIMYPGEHVVELKSLKFYFHQFREKLFSYERLINVIYDDLMKVYKPERLRIMIDFNPRGGISSRLTVDSDWAARGGKDIFKNWNENPW